MDKIALGIDLGGTKLDAGIMNSSGNLNARMRCQTEAQKGPNSVINKIKFIIESLIKQQNIQKRDIAGIGIGIPGFIDSYNGKIAALTNLPGWENIPLSDIIKSAFNLPVKIDNDANVAAYGEYLYGSGSGTNNFFYMTVSTGIGGGIIVNGKAYHGANHGAGEIGHIIIDMNGEKCSCGNYGCFEAMASGTAMAKFAEKAMDMGHKSIINEIAGNRAIKAEHVFEAAVKGDSLAVELVNKEALYLGIGICNTIAMYNPERIAIGGGISNQWDVLYPKIMETVKNRALKHNLKACDIVKAELGSNSGIIGAAALILH